MLTLFPEAICNNHAFMIKQEMMKDYHSTDF